MARIPYADGLSGGPTAWWDTNAFDVNDLSARVIKLHGSINWCQFLDDPLPRRIGSSIEIQDQDDIPLLIWPSSTKYQEAQLDPFAQLLNRARTALRPNAGAQILLVICGYSFGDRHVNLEIDRSLHESGGNLTIAAFTDRNEPTGQLKQWREDSLVRDQVLVFANRGFYHGDDEKRFERRPTLVEVRESDTDLERRCVNMAEITRGEPIENLAIGKIIEVDGSRIIAELNADLTELSRIYGGEVYPIGQFGSIVRVHFGRRLIYGFVGRLRMKAEYELERGMLPSTSGDERIIQADLFGEGEWQHSNDGHGPKLEFERGVATYPLPQQTLYLTPKSDLRYIYGHSDGASIQLGEHVGSGGAPCYAHLNELLGKHTAILGSTGAGKSAAVAAMLHSILEGV